MSSLASNWNCNPNANSSNSFYGSTNSACCILILLFVVLLPPSLFQYSKKTWCFQKPWIVISCSVLSVSYGAKCSKYSISIVFGKKPLLWQAGFVDIFLSTMISLTEYHSIFWSCLTSSWMVWEPIIKRSHYLYFHYTVDNLPIFHKSILPIHHYHPTTITNCSKPFVWI